MAVHDLTVGQRTAILGAQIRAEDGVGNAVALLERYSRDHQRLV